jgi:heme oxygenase (mycobilin-producing)
LLKPTDGREQWLVVSRWRDEESFQAWLNPDSFAHGHRSTAERRGQGTPTPVATHSEVWVLHTRWWIQFRLTDDQPRGSDVSD